MGLIINLTQRSLDDSVAELAERSCSGVALHANAVGQTSVKLGQHSVPHSRTENHLTLVVDALVVERTVVDVEAFDRPLVRVRLLHVHNLLIY